MHVGPRFDVTPVGLSGVKIPWVDKMRYLGVLIVQSSLFKCLLNNAKKAFCRSANAIFGKIGKIASEEVTLKIIRCKCIRVLLYGTEACLLNKSDLSSLDFVINRLFMKLVKTNNWNCWALFGSWTRSSAVTERPGDASCLSVYSQLQHIYIYTPQFFITSYCGFRFTSA